MGVRHTQKKDLEVVLLLEFDFKGFHYVFGYVACLRSMVGNLIGVQAIDYMPSTGLLS